MLFSTEYPSYQDPIGEAHESRPHPISHAVQKIVDYIGDFLGFVFVMAFTGLEILFVVALIAVVVQGLTSWDVVNEVVNSATQSWQAWAR
ncbi:MAG: hypothetical protein WCC58_05500 [Burkholderiales bacterium]